MMLLYLCVLSLLLLSSETVVADWSTVSFSRRFATCDAADQALTAGTTRVLYSYSNEVPTSPSNIHRHHGHGTKSVRLLAPPPPSPPLPADVATIDLRADNGFQVPFSPQSPTTTYWCKAFQLNLPSKRHLIQVDPVIEPASNLGTVHHILVYVCDPAIWQHKNYTGTEGFCDQLDSHLEQCLGGALLAAWAVGGGSFVYPSSLGLPLGPPNYPMYAVMQTHYNNPNQVTVIDQSGLRLYHTGILRNIDAGMFYTGMFTDPTFTIPANTSGYTYEALCPGQCTRTLLGPAPTTQGITVYATLLHMHLTGSKISLHQYRNINGSEVELTPILDNPYYDFNFQDFEIHPQQITLMPGDALKTRCTYDTTGRPNVTTFGESTQQEMCLAFMIYYPRMSDNFGSNCLFGNYTNTPVGKQYNISSNVQCGDSYEYNVAPLRVDSPYTPPNCTHSLPDDVSTTPVVKDITAFDPSIYDAMVYLDENQQYALYYAADHNQSIIHLAIQVNNSGGWAGLGFSPTGGMLNSDMLIAAMAQLSCSAPTSQNSSLPPCSVPLPLGTPMFHDRFAYQHALPPIDALQDYFDVVFYVNNGGSPSPKLSTASILAIIASIIIIIAAISYCLFRKKPSDNTSVNEQYVPSDDNTELSVNSDKYTKLKH